jgi:hypothetical protein
MNVTLIVNKDAAGPFRVERLLAANADVNAAATFTGGRTALQAAARGGHLHVTERLKRAGAKI